MALPLLALAIPTVWGWVAGGTAVAAGVGAAAYYHKKSKDEAYSDGKRAGVSAGQAAAQKKYQDKVDELAARLRSYHKLDDKVLGLYAVGMAAAAANGTISRSTRQELDEFIAGCLSGDLSPEVRKMVARFQADPPKLTAALKYAATRNVSRMDVDALIELVLHDDGDLEPLERRFKTQWRNAESGYPDRYKAA